MSTHKTITLGIRANTDSQTVCYVFSCCPAMARRIVSVRNSISKGLAMWSFMPHSMLRRRSSSRELADRAMMGRCQGGYCQMRITRMLEEELGIPVREITYAREGSRMFFGKVRE